MKLITSVHNEQLKHLNKLIQSAKFRREQGQTVLEGIHLLDVYLNAGGLPNQVFVPSNRLHHHEVVALLARVSPDCITQVEPSALAKISSLSDAQEVMTLIDLPPSQVLPTQEDCVVLENVQDVGNIGTILRSVAASGVDTVILSKGCADVWSPKVLRAGMGAHFLLTIHERVDLLAWRGQYRSPVLVTALSEQNPYSLYDANLNLRQANAWVFGNEGAGVSVEILAQADATVKIPMLRNTESLNVAMAATVCLFEQMRQRLC